MIIKDIQYNIFIDDHFKYNQLSFLQLLEQNLKKYKININHVIKPDIIFNYLIDLTIHKQIPNLIKDKLKNIFLQNIIIKEENIQINNIINNFYLNLQTFNFITDPIVFICLNYIYNNFINQKINKKKIEIINIILDIKFDQYFNNKNFNFEKSDNEFILFLYFDLKNLLNF